MQENRRIGLSLLVVAFIAVVYVSSYLVLSMSGAYTSHEVELQLGEAGSIISIPINYSWAPQGFAGEDGQWNLIHDVYLPLYWVDTRWWHTHDLSDRGLYPIRRHPADGP